MKIDIQCPYPYDPNPKSIPLKYAPVAIIPYELVADTHYLQKYKLVGGEIVTFQYRATTDNTYGTSEKYLNQWTQELYNMDFNSFQHIWKRRLGTLKGFWYRVKMELSE